VGKDRYHGIEPEAIDRREADPDAGLPEAAVPKPEPVAQGISPVPKAVVEFLANGLTSRVSTNSTSVIRLSGCVTTTVSI